MAPRSQAPINAFDVVAVYLCNFLPGAAKIDEGDVNEVGAIANGNSFLFE